MVEMQKHLKIIGKTMFFASWQFEFELEKFEKYNQKTKSETYLHR